MRNGGQMQNGMQERRYLLDIRQMLEGDGGAAVLQKAFARIDGERRRKALPLKSVRAQAASVGAGLLIQKALSEDRDIGKALQRFSVEELLLALSPSVIEPRYRYGENGKPYLEGRSFYFNLSHSGDYVFCGVSGQEIGVDIQKFQGQNELGLARRFFSSAERQALEACGDEESRRSMFFRMWTRKEAYGKLTGEGLGGAVGKDFWTEEAVGKDLRTEEAVGKDLRTEEAVGKDPRTEEAVGKDLRTEEAVRRDLWTDGAIWKAIPADSGENESSRASEFRTPGPGGKELLWEEYEELPGYQIAVCRYGI